MSGFTSFLTGALNQMNRMHEDERDNERRFAEKYAARFDEALSVYRTKSAAADERRKQGEAMRMQGVPDPVIRQIIRGQLKLEDWQEGRVKLRSGQVIEASAPDPVVPDGLRQSLAPQPTGPSVPGQGAPAPRGDDVSQAGRMLFGRRSGQELIAAGRRATGMEDGMIDQVMSGKTPDPAESFGGDPNATVTVQGDPLEILAKRRLDPEDFKNQQSFQAAVAALRDNPSADISQYIDPEAKARRAAGSRQEPASAWREKEMQRLYQIMYDQTQTPGARQTAQQQFNTLTRMTPSNQLTQGVLNEAGILPGLGPSDTPAPTAAAPDPTQVKSAADQIAQQNPNDRAARARAVAGLPEPMRRPVVDELRKMGM
ncbi:MAG: hypothetical protein IM557_10955 [Chitinophagaceae bacterium]|nr:hypothetical protein [Chitinophagaceae bacterium]